MRLGRDQCHRRASANAGGRNCKSSRSASQDPNIAQVSHHSLNTPLLYGLPGSLTRPGHHLDSVSTCMPANSGHISAIEGVEVSIWWWAPVVLVLVVWLAARGGRLKRALGRVVEHKLGGYRHEVEPGDKSLPREIREEAPKVAVVGGGLAGIGAASALGERGIDVTLLEHNAYLGGKIGAWKVPVGDGAQTVEHGF
ncbi:MAG: NAD(P)-binding protein, partial [Deltaproteobacteria bacterium]|nr:NAD(P)-binding protein [Deltaproteobacteria bacterium]